MREVEGRVEERTSENRIKEEETGDYRLAGRG